MRCVVAAPPQYEWIGASSCDRLRLPEHWPSVAQDAAYPSCAQPLLGARAESFFWGDGLALGLVLVGFAVNQGCSPEGRAARRPAGQRVEPAPTSASESERQYVAATFE